MNVGILAIKVWRKMNNTLSVASPVTDVNLPVLSETASIKL